MTITGCNSSSSQEDTNTIQEDTNQSTDGDDTNDTNEEVILKDSLEYSDRLYELRTTPSFFDLGTSQDPLVN